MTKEEADDIKRHFDLVAEGLRDENRLTKLETSQANLQTRVERLEAKLAS